MSFTADQEVLVHPPHGRAGEALFSCNKNSYRDFSLASTDESELEKL